MIFWAKYAKTYGAHTLQNDVERKVTLNMSTFIQKNIRFNINPLSSHN